MCSIGLPSSLFYTMGWILIIHIMLMYNIQSVAAMNITTPSCHDERVDPSISDAFQVGRVYHQLLTDLYRHWNISLQFLSVISDLYTKDKAGRIVSHITSTTTVIHREVIDSIDDVLTSILQETDNTHFLLILSDENFHQIISKAIEKNLYFHCYVWIFLRTNKRSPSDTICKSVKNMNLYVVSPLLISDDKEKASYSTQLLECQNNTSAFEQTMQWTFHGIIKKKRGISRVPSTIPFLRVVALHEEPYSYKTERTYVGYHIDIVDYIAREEGFEYVLLDCNGNLFGSRDEKTQQWSGCVSDLYYGRADLIAAPLHLVSIRKTAIDYIIPWSGYSGIIILAEQRAREQFFFLKVFSIEIWAIATTTIAFTSILICVYERSLRHFHLKNKDNADSVDTDTRFKESVWFVVSSTAFEASQRHMKSFSTRILIAGFWIFSNVFMSVVVANMSAFLMSSSLKGDISSVSDILSQHTINCSVLRDSSMFVHIDTMKSIEQHFDKIWTKDNLEDDINHQNVVWKNPLKFTFTQLMKRIFDYGLVNTTTHAVDTIRKSQGRFVFITESASAEFLAGTYCDLRTIGRKIGSQPFGFGIRKHSKLKDSFSRGFLKLQHTSRMHEIRKKWWKRNTDCTTVGEDKEIRLREMEYTFYVMVTGLGIGLIGLIIEQCYEKTKRKQLQL